jgi:hypothetical protein
MEAELLDQRADRPEERGEEEMGGERRGTGSRSIKHPLYWPKALSLSLSLASRHYFRGGGETALCFTLITILNLTAGD